MSDEEQVTKEEGDQLMADINKALREEHTRYAHTPLSNIEVLSKAVFWCKVFSDNYGDNPDMVNLFTACMASTKVGSQRLDKGNKAWN